MRVKTTGPFAVTSTFSSSRHVCSRPGCPANVSMAKYMFSLISAGYLSEYAREIHIPSYNVIPMLCANCCSVTVPYLSSSYGGNAAATSAVVLPGRSLSRPAYIESYTSR